LRVPLGRPVQPRSRSGQGARVPRRDVAQGFGQGRALLLHVRAALLLDEDHAGCARLRRQAGGFRRGSAGQGDGGQGRRIRREGRGDLLEGLRTQSRAESREQKTSEGSPASTVPLALSLSKGERKAAFMIRLFAALTLTTNGV